MKPSLLLTRKLPGNAIEQLEQYFKTTINSEDRVMEKHEILENISDKEALLCLLTDVIDKEVIDAASKLKVISNYAVGFNNIDVKYATQKNIPVCITPGILTDTTADLTFALILSVMRRIVEADHYTRSGLFTGWGPSLFLGTDIYNKTLGIIGMGRIGEAVMRRAKGFGMKIIYYNRSPKKVAEATQVSFEELLASSDVISLHTPLTSETHHLIDEQAFKKMKKSAFLINTTRGAVVDEAALVNALQNNIISGAGLDVYEREPDITEALLKLNNVVLLPHIGSATFETRSKMASLAVSNVIAIFRGERPYAIANPEVL